MTNLQALQSISPFSANTLLYSKVLTDMEIAEDATYDSSLSENIKLASAYVAKSLYIQPDFKEGSLSVNYDKENLKKYANDIFEQNGLNDEIIKGNKISII